MSQSGLEIPTPLPIHEVIAPKLEPGDTIAIVAPGDSLAMVAPDKYQNAVRHLGEMGLEVVTAPNTSRTEKDWRDSTPLEARVEDLEWAHANPAIKGIIAAKGGHNSIEVVRELDWDLIGNYAKFFSGFSDATVLIAAYTAMTNQIANSGPTLMSLGAELPDGGHEYSLDSFKQAAFESGWRAIEPSREWTDDGGETMHKTGDYSVINPGEAEGRIVGGNLGSLYLTQGTKFFPGFNEPTILFVEDDDEAGEYSAGELGRRLNSLMMQEGATENVKGLVLGRFEPGSDITIETVRKVIESIHDFDELPVIAGVDYGHTQPKATIPMGGQARIQSHEDGTSLIEVNG